MIVTEGVCTVGVVVYPFYTSVHSCLTHLVLPKTLHQARRLQIKCASSGCNCRSVCVCVCICKQGFVSLVPPNKQSSC